MTNMLKKSLGALVLAGALLTQVPGIARADEIAICYNCPPEWADWAAQIKAIKDATGITVPFDNKNSGQSIAAVIAEKANPVADVLYLGGQVGIQAKEQGLTQPYKPKGFETIPTDLKDPDGYWFTIHSGTLGFMVNKDALGGKPVPQSWKDLLKPEYKGMVGYLDPTSAAVGFVGATAVNGAMGGSYKNYEPAVAYFKALAKNEPIVPKQTAYARVLSGEIPILLDYDFDAYRAKYKDNAPIVFVIPAEGTVTFPYVMAMVAHDPHEANAKKVLDFVLSDAGQRLWAQAFLRPVNPAALTPELAAKFLPASDYARSKPLDLAALATAQKAFTERYQAEVH
jgi:putative spermidine/putrescine transport system substrate-binding protein